MEGGTKVSKDPVHRRRSRGVGQFCSENSGISALDSDNTGFFCPKLRFKRPEFVNKHDTKYWYFSGASPVLMVDDCSGCFTVSCIDMRLIFPNMYEYNTLVFLYR